MVCIRWKTDPAAQAWGMVEGYRDAAGKVRHRIVAKLGRRDRLKASGAPARPTAANIFAAFAHLGFHRVCRREGLTELPDPLTPTQHRILSVLGVHSILPS